MMKLHEQIRKESSEKYLDDSLEVGVPGLEPGKTGPESVVLPITPYPNLLPNCFGMPSRFRMGFLLVCDCKVTMISLFLQAFFLFFSQNILLCDLFCNIYFLIISETPCFLIKIRQASCLVSMVPASIKEIVECYFIEILSVPPTPHSKFQNFLPTAILTNVFQRIFMSNHQE